VKKPDPRIYRIALARLNMMPAETIFVDDMAENVDAARALGMRGVQFKNTAQTIAEAQALLDGKN
jgi:HAD superfamily hydrolase (TIGR01509 family)